MLKRIRRILAAVVIVLITLLFLDISGILHHWLGWLAKVQFLPALLALNIGVLVFLIVATLVFGRIYCSVVCPLGILQDLIVRLKPKKFRRYSYSPERGWLRYGVLGATIVAFFLGANSLVALLAPYSSFGRMVQNLLKPFYEWGNNALAAIAEHVDSYAFYSVDVWMLSLPTFIIAAVTFVVIFILAWRGGRTYCNTICPVGTLLSFIARFSWFRIHFDEEKCKHCGQCAKACKASAIDLKTLTVDYSRCVVCGNCLDQCKFDSLHYKALKARKKTEGEPVDNGRRSFLVGAALATTAVALSQEKKKVDGGLATIEDKAPSPRRTPLTPPGSLSASNMQKRCTGCQLCVSQCPNNVLRPTISLMTLMQPTMSYELGYCRSECNRCSEVCPSGAIKPISLENKSSTQIGHAVWVKKNCLPVAEGVECGNCERHCPVGAITMVPLDENDELSPLVPTVNEARCIGCGACENLCPARPFTAIYVEGHEVHREV